MERCCDQPMKTVGKEKVYGVVYLKLECSKCKRMGSKRESLFPCEDLDAIDWYGIYGIPVVD